MRRAIAILCILLAPPAAAAPFAGCDKGQSAVATEAMSHAKQLTLKAATAVGDTPEYRRWFGTYSTPAAEVVRANLKSIVGALRGGGVEAICETDAGDGCSEGEYAWVIPDEPFVLHLCPPFFDLPPLTALRPGSLHSDDGTREGTIVHELSHFYRAASTDDYCYARSECSEMAQYDWQSAILNADSYQYFTEDVSHYARQPVAGKPPRANRKD